MIRSFSELTVAQQASAGGKGGTLAQLYRAGFPVPDGFVVLPSAFDGDELMKEAWIQVQSQLKRLREKSHSVAFAVCSSALAEDSAQASFAGEFETVLDVRSDKEVREAIQTVRRSRRSDVFDSHTPLRNRDTEIGRANTILGSPGAAGVVEAVVRRLDRPEEGDQLREGEVLVTMQTDIAWTLLFPRASAIVTDVGAPLSHAAIVARELGIPAVVGCGDATMRLKTGDRVLVNGGRGTVEILETPGGRGVTHQD